MFNHKNSNTGKASHQVQHERLRKKQHKEDFTGSAAFSLQAWYLLLYTYLVYHIPS